MNPRKKELFGKVFLMGISGVSKLKANASKLLETRPCQLSIRWLHDHLSHRRYDRSLLPVEHEIVWVKPRDICGHLSPDGWRALKIRTGFDGGAVVAGSWDTKHTEYLSFRESDPFASCKAHWIEGRPWPETTLYKQQVESVKLGVAKSFSNLQQLSMRYAGLDEIYEKVARHGQLSTDFRDLVKISMGRNGELIWGPDGRHRICIALCLGLTEIPARIGFIHAGAIDGFQAFRRGTVIC